MSDASGSQPNQENVSTTEKPRPTGKTECLPVHEKPNHEAPKITVHDRKWTDGTVPLDAVPSNLAKLGKASTHLSFIKKNPVLAINILFPFVFELQRFDFFVTICRRLYRDVSWLLLLQLKLWKKPPSLNLL